MKVPYKPASLPRAYRKYKYIIVHDFSCQFPNYDGAKIDNGKPNINDVRFYNWTMNDLFEMNFHFVCEKLRDDYETIIARPLNFYCEYPDIPSQYLASIHIGIVGRFDVASPEQRMYQQVAYRAIAPMLRWFNIPLTNVFMHHELTMDDNVSVCPGENISKNKLMSNLNQFILFR